VSTRCTRYRINHKPLHILIIIAQHQIRIFHVQDYVDTESSCTEIPDACVTKTSIFNFRRIRDNASVGLHGSILMTMNDNLKGSNSARPWFPETRDQAEGSDRCPSLLRHYMHVGSQSSQLTVLDRRCAQMTCCILLGTSIRQWE
jgi:hypothetical protein